MPRLDTDFIAHRRGSTEITKIYRGSTLMWESGPGVPDLVMSNHVAPVSAVTTAATLVIPSVALTGGRLHLLACTADRGSNAALTDPVVTQVGATWAPIDHQGYATTDRRKVSLFRCQPASGVSAADITVNWTDTTVRRVAVVDISNDQILNDTANNGAACIVQPESNFNNAAQLLLTVTLDATPASDSVTYGAGSIQTAAANTINPGDGFDELSDLSTASGVANNIVLATEAWDVSAGGADTVVDMVRGTGTSTWGLIACEIAHL